MSADAPRILIANPFGIGDVLFSMIVAQQIRRSRPRAVIGFLCNERTIDLVRLNTSLDKTFEFNRDRFRGLWPRHPVVLVKKLKALLQMIRAERFDTLLDFSLGRQYSLFAWWLGIPKRVGFDFRGRGLFLTHKKKIKGYESAPVADTQLGLLEVLGIESRETLGRIPLKVSASAHSEAAADLKKHGFSDHEKILALAPGGGESWGPNAFYKQWNPERFATAVNVLAARSGFKILLLGDTREKGLLDKTAAQISAAKVVLAGESLEKVCAYLLRSKLLLCNDGGLLHLANALGTPTVSIFGPVDENVYGPYRPSSPHAVLTEAVPCRPCYHRFYFPPCPYERRCLEGLGPKKVIEAVEKIA